MSIRITDVKAFNQDTQGYLDRLFAKDKEYPKYYNIEQLLSNDNRNLIGINAENSVATISIVYDSISNTLEYALREKYNEDEVKSYKSNLEEAKRFLNESCSAIRTIIKSEDVEEILSNVIRALKNTQLYNENKVDLGNSISDLDLNNPRGFLVDIENPMISAKNLFESILNYEPVEKITIKDLNKIERNIFDSLVSVAGIKSEFTNQLYNAFGNIGTDKDDIIDAEIIDAEIIEDKDHDNDFDKSPQMRM